METQSTGLPAVMLYAARQDARGQVSTSIRGLLMAPVETIVIIIVPDIITDKSDGIVIREADRCGAKVR